jgi:Tfp pilus assembly protein PilN
MKALELDFHRSGPASPWAGRLLLAVAVAFAGYVGLSYYGAQDSIAGSEARLAELDGQAASLRRVWARPQNVSSEELAFAQETIGRLSTPWSNLFGALESRTPHKVSLLSIEPDRESGTVLIAGEAADYLAALNYVLELRRAGTLADVHLVKHEMRRAPGPYPLSFSVAARWKEASR